MLSLLVPAVWSALLDASHGFLQRCSRGFASCPSLGEGSVYISHKEVCAAHAMVNCPQPHEEVRLLAHFACATSLMANTPGRLKPYCYCCSLTLGCLFLDGQ